MKLNLILLVGAVLGKDTIKCSECYYSFAEVDGYITPLSGDSKCMTEPKTFPDKEYPLEGEVNGVKFRTKCTTIEASGVETVSYEDESGKQKEFDIDYNIYDRRALRAYEGTSFYDYEGEVVFAEDATICGANRTECSGDSRKRNLESRLEDDSCPVDSDCPCPRCDWVRVLQKEEWKDIDGDMSCQTGEVDDSSKQSCQYAPNGPAYGLEINNLPSVHRGSTFQSVQHLLPRELQAYPMSNMGAYCVIYEEFLKLPTDDNFEQVELHRSCDHYAPAPYNFYSVMKTNSSAMTICHSNLCNQKGSQNGIFISFSLLLITALINI